MLAGVGMGTRPLPTRCESPRPIRHGPRHLPGMAAVAVSDQAMPALVPQPAARAGNPKAPERARGWSRKWGGTVRGGAAGITAPATCQPRGFSCPSGKHNGIKRRLQFVPWCLAQRARHLRAAPTPLPVLQKRFPVAVYYCAKQRACCNCQLNDTSVLNGSSALFGPWGDVLPRPLALRLHQST